jgi:hypothetical protein
MDEFGFRESKARLRFGNTSADCDSRYRGCNRGMIGGEEDSSCTARGRDKELLYLTEHKTDLTACQTASSAHCTWETDTENSLLIRWTSATAGFLFRGSTDLAAKRRFFLE